MTSVKSAAFLMKFEKIEPEIEPEIEPKRKLRVESWPRRQKMPSNVAAR